MNLSVASKCNSSFYVNTANLLYPTQCLQDDDDVTITISNASTYTAGSYKARALSAILQKEEFAGALFQLNTATAIADSGTTQNFVMEGTNVINKRRTTHPLKVTLADGQQVVSTHMYDIHIAGLPFVLMGHIIPDLSIAFLFGIQVLTEVGCNVTFDKHKCTVRYNKKTILSGDKDPSMDLWTLPLGSLDMTTHCIHDVILLAAAVHADTHAHIPTLIECFTHTVRTKANSLCFAHQSLCSPRISTLLKAIRRGYLKRCPNLPQKG